MKNLTGKEILILGLASYGLSAKGISERSEYKVNTVYVILMRIRKTLGVKTNEEAAKMYLEWLEGEDR